jgi:putative phosphoribosyl transferase
MIDNTSTRESTHSERPVRVEAGAVDLDGLLSVPAEAHGLVILARGIESNEHESPFPSIAQAFNQRRLATLQVEMFTPDELELDRLTGYFAQNVDITQQRFFHMADWLLQYEETRNFSIGYFGTGPCGAAALVAAAERPDNVRTVVSAGGTIELARAHLGAILAPVLLIAAGNDSSSVQAHQSALAALKGQKAFETVAGASTLFADQRGTDEVIRLAGEWFTRWLVTII